MDVVPLVQMSGLFVTASLPSPWSYLACDLPCVQPFAGLLPSEVNAPGAPVAPVTAEAADATGLPEDCLICAGTTGKLPTC